MDFDDMPDSYFAFLSNQRKLAEPDKINGAMRDLGRGADPEPSRGGKVRSRSSQPNLSSGSKPSVPSLPSIQRTSAPAPAPPHPSARGFVTPAGPAGRPQLGSKPPTGPTPGSRPNPMPLGPPGHMPMAHPGQVNQMSHPGYPGQLGHGHPGAPPGYPVLNQMPNQMAPMNPMAHPGHMSGANVLPSNNYTFGARMQASAAPRSNALVFVLIVILVAAIGVLAYLVMTK
jgi:hypothetical protein